MPTECKRDRTVYAAKYVPWQAGRDWSNEQNKGKDVCAERSQDLKDEWEATEQRYGHGTGGKEWNFSEKSYGTGFGGSGIGSGGGNGECACIQYTIQGNEEDGYYRCRWNGHSGCNMRGSWSANRWGLKKLGGGKHRNYRHKSRRTKRIRKSIGRKSRRRKSRRKRYSRRK